MSKVVCIKIFMVQILTTARLAQSVERKTLNLVVVGSSPTVGDFFFVEILLFISVFFSLISQLEGNSIEQVRTFFEAN